MGAHRLHPLPQVLAVRYGSIFNRVVYRLFRSEWLTSPELWAGQKHLPGSKCPDQRCRCPTLDPEEVAAAWLRRHRQAGFYTDEQGIIILAAIDLYKVQCPLQFLTDPYVLLMEIF